MAFYDHNGRDISDSLDRWITGNWGDDDPAVRSVIIEPLSLEDLADLVYECDKENE